MSQAGSLVVFREDKYLGFASESAKGRTMKNAVSVPFEAGSLGVWLLG
jgi:hypothetical protein